MGGKSVAALYNQMADQKAAGIPPHWLSYVSVESADQAAARAAELGGTVLAPAFDVMEAGRMAVIQDPTGGVLAAGSSAEAEPRLPAVLASATAPRGAPRTEISHRGGVGEP